MLYLYKYREKEYAVKVVERKEESETVSIKFLLRTSGGKGRMPKEREVKYSDLITLKDTLEG